MPLFSFLSGSKLSFFIFWSSLSFVAITSSGGKIFASENPFEISLSSSKSLSQKLCARIFWEDLVPPSQGPILSSETKKTFRMKEMEKTIIFETFDQESDILTDVDIQPNRFEKDFFSDQRLFENKDGEIIPTASIIFMFLHQVDIHSDIQPPYSYFLKPLNFIIFVGTIMGMQHYYSRNDQREKNILTQDLIREIQTFKQNPARSQLRIFIHRSLFAEILNDVIQNERIKSEIEENF